MRSVLFINQFLLLTLLISKHILHLLLLFLEQMLEVCIVLYLTKPWRIDCEGLRISIWIRLSCGTLLVPLYLLDHGLEDLFFEIWKHIRHFLDEQAAKCDNLDFSCLYRRSMGDSAFVGLTNLSHVLPEPSEHLSRVLELCSLTILRFVYIIVTLRTSESTTSHDRHLPDRHVHQWRALSSHRARRRVGLLSVVSCSGQ